MGKGNGKTPKTVIRSPGGAGRREVLLSSVLVPDLWHVAQGLKNEGRPKAGDQVLEVWYLAHDLLANLRGEV